MHCPHVVEIAESPMHLLSSGLCSVTAFAYEFCQGTKANAGAGLTRPCPVRGDAALDPIEKAIRNALEKGDPLDPAFRKRVYASAEVALSRSMAAHTTMGKDAKDERIRKLHRFSALIEDEFAPATEDVELPAIQPPLPMSDFGTETLQQEPRLRSSEHKQMQRPQAERPMGKAQRAAKSRTNLLIYTLFLALLAMLGWLFWTSGIPERWSSVGGGNTQASPKASGAPKLGNASDESEGWISVFAAADAATIELTGGMAAELTGSGSTAYVLLRPPGGQPGKAVATIEVGRGLLETFSGKKIVFDIRAKASSAEGAQISIVCELAGMGECQRTRFRLDNQLSDNLVSVQLNDKAPEASGVLSISPHIEGKAEPVEIHSIRVREAAE